MSKFTSLLRKPGDALLAFGSTHGLVPAFALAAFLEATFVPLLIDLLIFSFLMTGTVKAWKLILTGAIASTIGTMLFWGAGAVYGPSLVLALQSFFEISTEQFDIILTEWNTNWFAYTWIALLTAIPDGLLAAFAGTTQVPWWQFTPAIFVIFIVRFGIYAGVAVLMVKLMKKTTAKTQHLVTSISFILSLLAALGGVVVIAINSV